MTTSIRDIVKEYVRDHNLPSLYRQSANSPYKTFMETLCTRLLAVFPVHFQANEEEHVLTLTSFLPIYAIVERCDETCHLVDRLNCDRDNHAFFLSFSDTGGKVSYSTKYDFTSPEPTVHSIRESVDKNLSVAELWLPAFALVMFAGMSAEEVLALEPQPEHWDSCFWFFGIVDCHACPD